MLPVSAGLPLELPADYVEAAGFVEFSALPGARAGGADPAPLAARLSFDGVAVSSVDRARTAGVFGETFGARLPEAGRIRASLDGKGREAWLYPEGTEVAHIAWLRQPGPGVPRLFEARLARKVAPSRWAFGIYTPTPSGALRLNRQDDPTTPARLEFRAFDVERARWVQVSSERLHVESCRVCHFSVSPSRDQYASPEEAGPCGFVPAHPGLKGDWATRYEKERGHNPFE